MTRRSRAAGVVRYSGRSRRPAPTVRPARSASAGGERGGRGGELVGRTPGRERDLGDHDVVAGADGEHRRGVGRVDAVEQAGPWHGRAGERSLVGGPRQPAVGAHPDRRTRHRGQRRTAVDRVVVPARHAGGRPRRHPHHRADGHGRRPVEQQLDHRTRARVEAGDGTGQHRAGQAVDVGAQVERQLGGGVGGHVDGDRDDGDRRVPGRRRRDREGGRGPAGDRDLAAGAARGGDRSDRSVELATEVVGGHRHRAPGRSQRGRHRQGERSGLAAQRQRGTAGKPVGGVVDAQLGAGHAHRSTRRGDQPHRQRERRWRAGGAVRRGQPVGQPLAGDR